MTIRRKLTFTALAAVLSLSGLACRKPAATVEEKTTGRTAAQLLEEGEANLKRKRWEEGRKLLRMVEDYFPGSPEFSKAKILLGDSFFFAGTPSYPEAQVEYQSFLNYFPRHDMREYALHRIALCHFASIENAERDQGETQKALQAFQALIQEAPGSGYVVDSRAKVTQCWRRLAESELMVGIFYVYWMQYPAAERRLKGLLETYPEYVDRERAYFYLGEALRKKRLTQEAKTAFDKEYMSSHGFSDDTPLNREQTAGYLAALKKLEREEETKFRAEARSFYQKLVESYPKGDWAGRAKDRLLEMGQTAVKEELDS